MKIEWSESAELELSEAFDYIAVDSKPNATAWALEVRSKVDILAFFPKLGRVYEDSPKYRVWLVHKNYKAIYHIEEENDLVVIDALWHGARQDWQEK
jgi:plasmid stabilization system protein ParE